MQISVDATIAKLHYPSSQVIDLLNEALSFDDPSQRFIFAGGKARLRSNQKKIKLFNPVARTFPAGLLPLVCKELRRIGVAYSVTDSAYYVDDSKHPTEWLRSEQKEGVERAIKRKRGILWVPTGGGKTEIAIGLVLRLRAKWLFVVHRAGLLHQTAQRYKLRTGKDAGKIGDGNFDVREFTVATFQTLAKGLKNNDPKTCELIGSVQAIIVDESHTLPADSFWNTAMSCTNAAYRFGLSGTPLARKDGKGIYSVAALGPVIFRIHPDELIKAGLLAKPIIHMPILLQTSSKPTWQGVYGECITRSTQRNKLLTTFARAAEKPALLFVKEIKHGNLLAERIRRAGVSCEFLSGKQATGIRKEAVSRLVKGDVDVLIVTVIFQEGIDIPSLRSVIVGSSGKSAIAAIQRVGRGMRKTKDKSIFHVFDINDRGHKNLDRWSRERKKAYRAEGYEVQEN